MANCSTENKSQLKFKEDNGDVKTHTLAVRGKLISVNGISNYANIDADLKAFRRDEVNWKFSVRCI